MASIRADLWCSAFVRRHNDAGNICVVSRRGDAIAGQVWVEIDHLNGQSSLFVKAPGFMHGDDETRWLFQPVLEMVDNAMVHERIEREAGFDPDFWLLTLESRNGDHGLAVISADV